MSPSFQLHVDTRQCQTRRRCAIGGYVYSATCPQLLIHVSQGPTTGSMCQGFQVGEACPIAQANWYEHGSRDGRLERYIVRQLQQVRNRQRKDDLAIYGDAPIPAVEYLFAPIAREGILIEEHSRTSQSLCVARRALLRAAAQGASRFCRRTPSDPPVLMNATLRRHLTFHSNLLSVCGR